jgi:HSP90 family molecular chaperone
MVNGAFMLPLPPRIVSPFTIYLFAASAHRGQDCDLAILRQSGVEKLFASNIFVVKKNVNVLPEFATFIQHSIAQSGM